MDPQGTFKPGYEIDRYEIICALASGGMGNVWLARLRGKRGFEKLFAIKAIRADLQDPKFEKMFLDEARIASRIQHPNVAQILDLGDERGFLYLVMEWVDGDSLANVHALARRQGAVVPLGIALRVIADACAGLHAAHEVTDNYGRVLGVIHRDVSPQNILIATTGTAKIIDFGIAKARDREGLRTRTGDVKGKPQYMAPEQARAGSVAIDRRVDIWSAGVCLYELLAGQLPFESADPFEVMRRVLGDEPIPSPPGVPVNVKSILARSVVRDPGGRFATAAEMRRVIEAAMVELELSVTTDDVAAFVAKYLPGQAAMRRDRIEQAMKTLVEHTREGPGQPEAPYAAGSAGKVRSKTSSGDDLDEPRATLHAGRRLARLGAGQSFGRYMIEARLGGGPSSEVYRALDTVLRRPVALKILREDADLQTKGRARIVREATAAAALDHPNAVAIYDVGELEGVPYLAMEYVSGRPLRHYVGDASIPLGQRLLWLADIAWALDAAHARGLVHRDVNPDKVIVRDDGTIKVVDFGIVRRAPKVAGTGTLADPASVPASAPASELAALAGTSVYLAPEQIRGQPLGASADQFGWAVTAYELLSGGALPWEVSGGLSQYVARVLADEPISLRSRSPQIPLEVSAVVQQALGRSPADRFPSMRAVAETLEPLAGQTLRRGGRPSMAPGALAGSGPASVGVGSSRTGLATARTWWRLLVIAAVAVVAFVVGMRSSGSRSGSIGPAATGSPSAPQPPTPAPVDAGRG